MDAGVGCRGGETTQYVHGVECRGVGTLLGMCTGVGCRGEGRLLRRRPEVEVGCLPLLCSTLFFEKGSLT